MTGTVLNAVGVLLGGGLGLLLGKGLKPGTQTSLMTMTGVSVLFLGIGGAMEELLTLSETGLATQGGMMLIVSIMLGTLIGEVLNIEGAFEHLGNWLKTISQNDQDSQFIDAFLTSSLTICIGAMAIVGAITEGLTGDYSILAAKAILDFMIVLLVTTSKGKGSLFAAVPLVLLQGSVTLLAGIIAPLMTDQALSNLSLVGNVLIFCVGLNLVFDKGIKVANSLPAILIAVAYAFLPF
ncbi:DUF554 domain-containing protein [Streptococcus moroccensis]|uniref:Membrane protein YqgA involved in biofilm formation n=1 Tax=Streptococcus moroccensis TaxID=1451356 RepID=A0ABT9YUT8_9STRE|nr:DUF554 domain-containing protein [Streptococcus moroccensis]MDQ0223489.1 putative membrane protein YqgA involved in biofilm formation [Streptococcus moroccensis]